MAVEWRHLIFGDVDSADYGIYISGDGVYNAPERAVEFVDVPGRNGAIELDQGRYNNITVTYPAGVFATTQEEFQEKISAFRNAILSQRWYQRLEDTYHPDEYRMGVYLSGLEVSPVNYNHAGEFELTFNCKPQRWLTVGEYPIPVKSGDVLENPCLFDSEPLIEIEGYGDVSFNGYTLTLDNAVLGETEIVHPDSKESDGTILNPLYHIDRTLFNVDDDITIPPITFTYFSGSGPKAYSNVSYTIASGNTITPTVKVPSYSESHGSNNIPIVVTFPTITQGALGLEDEDVEYKAQINVTATISTQDGGGTETFSLLAAVKFNPLYIQVVMSGSKPASSTLRQYYYVLPRVTVDSTISILGNPTYIDCEIGEAYRLENGSPISLNSKVAFGSDLPKLAPGCNQVTFDNTITDLKIVPRWWRV